ncbi:MAG: S8 family serine peptidase [Planctomycetes bacterium]|nr:S8 family serine peptidase [Planctomycetota bacterium]
MSSSLSPRVALAAFLFLGSLASQNDVDRAPSAPGDGQARLLQALQLAAERDFVAVPGEREFSGRMIVRPLQPETLAAAGLGAVAGVVRATALRALEPFGAARHVDATDEFLITVPAGTENLVARHLMGTLAFQYAEPDWTLYPIGCPNDTFFAQQWHHQANRMQSCLAWDLHTGNPSVSVGICDTGVLTTHEDLQLHRLEGYNAVDQRWESQGGSISPVHPHGTQTTGCAAANGDNGLGVSGVGWNLSHRMLRVSNVSTGSASLSVLQHAARTAVENGDKVASVSYSGADASSNLTTATYIKSIGGLLVWAAGNDNRNLTFGNRDSDDLIVVGGTDENDLKASFSAYGTFVDLVAPGVNVATTGTSSNSNYVYASGTSFACPLTAGLCALIWSRNPALTPDQVEAVLKGSTDDLGAAGVDNTFGYGRINAYKAMQQAGGGGGAAPVADFTGAPTSGTVPLAVAFTDASSNAPTAWSWDFGDGSGSSAQNPSHTYSQAGTYTVSLTASNAFGQDTETKVGYITVNPGGSTEQQIAFDGFESANYSGGTGWLGAWTASGDVSIRTDGPHSGTRHARLRSSTGLLRRQVDLTGVTQARVVFWLRLRSFESGDTFLARVTSGSTTLASRIFVNGEDDNAYYRYEFDLSGASGVVTVEFDANMNSTSDYAYVDDVEVRGVR